jgi:hypothetical protein
MHRWQTVVAGAATFASLAAVGFGVVPDANDIEGMVVVSRETAAGYGQVAFTLQARPVTGLYPGRARNLQLTLRNPYDVDLEVRSVRGELVASSRRECVPNAQNLVVRPYVGALPVVIPARKGRELGTVPIIMPTGATEKCARTTFTIRLSGTATRAKR